MCVNIVHLCASLAKGSRKFRTRRRCISSYFRSRALERGYPLARCEYAPRILAAIQYSSIPRCALSLRIPSELRDLRDRHPSGIVGCLRGCFLEKKAPFPNPRSTKYSALRARDIYVTSRREERTGESCA